MASPLTKYSFINAKLRARISQILSDQMFEQLARAPSLDAALALLRDTSFARLEGVYSATGDLKLAELELLKDEIELYRGIAQYVHRDSVELVQALLYQFEIDNLKNAIRIFFDATLRHRPDDKGAHYILYERILHDLPIDVIVNAHSFEEIAGVCEGTPYGPIIRKYSHTVESDGSLFRMEIAFDHFYYQTLLAAIAKLPPRDRDISLRFVGVEIDLQNINWIIRFKNFYDLPLEAIAAALVPGGYNLSRAMIDELYRAESVAAALQGFVRSTYPGLASLIASGAPDAASRLLLIHRILEEIMKHEVGRVLTGYPFTVGILLAYFTLKRNELKKIRVILNAKQYGLQAERIEGII